MTPRLRMYYDDEVRKQLTEIYRACITARIKSAQYYPEIDAEEFELESAECISADARNRFDYCIEKWVRTNGAD